MEFNGGGGIVGMGGGGFTPYVDYVGQHNANLNYVSSQQPSQAQLYGGGSFGAQPAAYAALGAAYGRATGGFRAPTPAQPSYGVYGGNAFGYRAPTPSPAPFQSAYAGGGIGSAFGQGAYGALAGGRYGGAVSNPWASLAASTPQSPFRFAGSPFSSAYGSPSIGTSPGMAQGYGGFNNFFGSRSPTPAAPQAASFAQRFGFNTPYSLYGNEGISAINRAAGISPLTGQQYGAPRALPFSGAYTSGGFGGAAASSPWANIRSPSTSYSAFQARSPYTQWFGATGNDPTKANAIYRLAGNTGYSPAAHAAVASMESRFNPATTLGSQRGIFQMSPNMWGDRPFNGSIGGMNYNQYKAAAAPAQIGAYGDWLTRGNVNTMNRGFNFPSYSPPVQAAALQAMQFGGNSAGWRNAYAAGNGNMVIAPNAPQASALGNNNHPTMNSMTNAYTNMMNRWGR